MLIAPVYCPPLPPPSHRTGNSISRGVNVGADASRASALTQGIEISLCLISKGIAPTGLPLGWRTQSRDPMVVMIWLRNRNGKFHCLEKEDPTIPLSLTLFFFFLITWQALGGAVTFPILPLEKPGKVLLPPRKMGSNQGLKGEMCSASQGFF